MVTTKVLNHKFINVKCWSHVGINLLRQLRIEWIERETHLGILYFPWEEKGSEKLCLRRKET